MVMLFPCKLFVETEQIVFALPSVLHELVVPLAWPGAFTTEQLLFCVAPLAGSWPVAAEQNVPADDCVAGQIADAAFPRRRPIRHVNRTIGSRHCAGWVYLRGARPRRPRTAGVLAVVTLVTLQFPGPGYLGTPPTFVEQ